MQIVDQSGLTIVSAGLNEFSHLIITMSDNTTIDAGVIEALPGRDGTNGTNGTNAPISLSIFKQGANGMITPQRFKWAIDLTVTAVLLMSNASDISVTIAGVEYNAETLVGVHIASGVDGPELIINDLTIVAGQESANAIIIF